MKALLNWFGKLFRDDPEPGIKAKPKMEVPQTVSLADDFSPTVPDLQILKESPEETDVSFGFDPYDTAEFSRK